VGHASRQEHGWTMKGDEKDPAVAAAATEAFNEALEFFRSHLKA
jgi:dienelactone hydrolase